MANNHFEIDLKKLKVNYQKIKNFLGPDTNVMPVVKANAYGHGLEACVLALAETNVKWLAVGNINEAETIRKINQKVAILILGPTDTSDFGKVLSAGFRVTLQNFQDINVLNTKAQIYNQRALIHLKVNTGMNRFGVEPKEVLLFCQEIYRYPNLQLEGIYTHLHSANNQVANKKQWQIFSEVLFNLQKQGIEIPLRHMLASQGILNFNQGFFELVRPGLLLYGLAGNDLLKVDPVLSWKARILKIRLVQKGDCISYECSFRPKKDIHLAVIGAGYSDGYGRGLSGKAQVLVAGKRCRVVGKINMNYSFIDISPAMRISQQTSPQEGDEAVLIGKQGTESILVEDLARWEETVEHEIVSRLPEKTERTYLTNIG